MNLIHSLGFNIRLSNSEDLSRAKQFLKVRFSSFGTTCESRLKGITVIRTVHHLRPSLSLVHIYPRSPEAHPGIPGVLATSFKTR